MVVVLHNILTCLSIFLLLQVLFNRPHVVNQTLFLSKPLLVNRTLFSSRPHFVNQIFAYSDLSQERKIKLDFLARKERPSENQVRANKPRTKARESK